MALAYLGAAGEARPLDGRASAFPPSVRRLLAGGAGISGWSSASARYLILHSEWFQKTSWAKLGKSAPEEPPARSAEQALAPVEIESDVDAEQVDARLHRPDIEREDASAAESVEDAVEQVASRHRLMQDHGEREQTAAGCVFVAPAPRSTHVVPDGGPHLVRGSPRPSHADEAGPEVLAFRVAESAQLPEDGILARP